ncbi:MAG TPA: glycosyltransferase family 4 protein [Actinomycetota bacterium]|nr:glycosyltransferase family 4 protein [Actinomycetota bacterium]
MRLLVITNDYPPVVGGIENYTYSLASRWTEDEVTVVTRWVPGCEKFDASNQIEVIREPVGTLLATPTLKRKIGELLDEGRFDAVHFPSAMPTSLVGPRVVAPRGIPYAVTAHGGEFLLASKLPWFKRQLKAVLSRASVILPQATTTEDRIRQWLPDHPPMVMVTCGVDIERYEPGPRDFDPPTILSVSRLVARKGPATLIRALPAVLARHPRAEALIVGGGPDLSRLERLAAKHRVQHAIRFMGSQPWEQVAQIYSSASVFALPTRERFGGIETEGLPLVFVEAAASGLPLIGGDAGGVKDAVHDGETGILVDGREPTQTADAINSLLDDPAAARAMGDRARTMAEKSFTWEHISEIFKQTLETYCR